MLAKHKIIIAGLAAFIVFLIFYMMQFLISLESGAIETNSDSLQISFLRTQQNQNDDIKNNKPPSPKLKKTKKIPLSVKNFQHPKPSPPQFLQTLPKNLLKNKLALINQLKKPADGDIFPLVRVAPQYPPIALNRAIEGWVLLEFTVSKEGFVVNPRIIKAEPDNIFNRAALQAVRVWRYKPYIVDGKPASRAGVKTVIAFELEK